jgi:pimeloyl-ACP methyl ester carboxylesterase
MTSGRSATEERITWLRHSKIELALHTLREAPGPALLLLHALGEQAPARLPKAFEDWPGPIHALDFTGHGRSGIPHGGGYTSEILMADADVTLERIGQATLCGRGLGAYVALLMAGGRPALVRGAILCDGPGLAGGGPQPVSPIIGFPDPGALAPPDPYAMVELARDLRPPDYATEFVHQANQLSPLERPITVCAAERPSWLEAVVETPGVEQAELRDALVDYAGARVDEAG